MKLNTESRYAIVSLFLVVTLYSLLLISLRKYYTLTFSHLVSLCKIAFADFLASKTYPFVLTILTLILLSSALLTLKVLVNYLKTRCRISALLKLKTDKHYKHLKKVVKDSKLKPSQVIVVNSKKYLAFNFGLTRPKIIISSGLIQSLSRKELEAVILHENYHLQRWHVPIFLFVEISKALLFFIPVVNTIVNKVRLGFEIKADKASTSFQGTNRYLRLAIAKTLNPTPYFELYPNFSTSLLEQRIGKLLNKEAKIPFEKRELLISFFIISVIVAMFIFPTAGYARTDYNELYSQPSCEGTPINATTLTTNMTTVY